MPKITNTVLTAPGQGLSGELKANARDNIDALRRLPAPSMPDNIVVTDIGGEIIASGIPVGALPASMPVKDGLHMIVAEVTGGVISSKWKQCQTCDDPLPHLP